MSEDGHGGRVSFEQPLSLVNCVNALSMDMCPGTPSGRRVLGTVPEMNRGSDCLLSDVPVCGRGLCLGHPHSEWRAEMLWMGIPWTGEQKTFVRFWVVGLDETRPGVWKGPSWPRNVALWENG